jgi:hypothetical protein
MILSDEHWERIARIFMAKIGDPGPSGDRRPLFLGGVTFGGVALLLIALILARCRRP